MYYVRSTNAQIERKTGEKKHAKDKVDFKEFLGVF